MTVTPASTLTQHSSLHAPEHLHELASTMPTGFRCRTEIGPHPC